LTPLAMRDAVMRFQMARQPSSMPCIANRNDRHDDCEGNRLSDDDLRSKGHQLLTLMLTLQNAAGRASYQ
jgi:hypothetical protein